MYENLEFNIVKKAVSEHCSFSLGKEYIENEDVHFDSLWIQRELKRGKEALALYSVYQEPSFAGVKDISVSLQAIEKGGIVSEYDLYQIACFSRAVLQMQKYLQQSELETPSIKDLIDSLCPQRKIIEQIEIAISDSYEVKNTASSQLKNIRRGISQCVAEISKETQKFILRHSEQLMDTITAIRDNRTCVLVKNSEKNKIKGFIHGESASGQAVYIEPEILLNLNNKLQSLNAQEKEEIHRILKELCASLKPLVPSYLGDLDTFTILDGLFAKAKWAYKLEGCYADLNEDDKTLIFKDARHPLIDQNKVIANTYQIIPPYHHLLITGSNTGGKTVTLKTIGLFTILTLAGFPILCEEALVPCFNGVYVDIGDSQSIVESLSTFSAHISKLAQIVKETNSNSLVLLDELGSGTDPNEGECIAIATLDYFRENHIMSVATTHYSKLKEYAKKKDDILLASMAFDVKKLCPSFKYLEGFSGNSNALEIAKRYHLKEEIIEHANVLKEEHKSVSEKLMEKLETERLNLSQERSSFDIELKQFKQQQVNFVSEKERIIQKQEALLLKAQEKATAIIERAKEEAEEVITSLKALKNNVKEHEIIALKSKLNQDHTEKDEEDDSEYVFKEKDYVLLKKLNYHGEILTLKGNRATIFANGMKMNVKTSDLEIMNRPFVPKENKNHISRIGSNKTIKSECNVIGMRVEEALAMIDKYLDSVLYNRIYDVRLIHGHGTGALRTAIHKYLKNNKYVESFRLGGEREGGMGATSVSLKRGGKNG